MKIDYDAESYCLGYVFHSKDALEDIQVAFEGNPFDSKEAYTIYECLLSDYASGYEIEYCKFVARLNAEGKCTEDILKFLLDAYDKGAGVDLKYYIDVMRRNQRIRNIKNLEIALSELIRQGKPITEIENLIESAAEIDNSQTDEEPYRIKSTLDDFRDGGSYEKFAHTNREAFDRGEMPLQGPSFGISDLDKSLRGYAPGQLTVLGARPSMGKSEFLVFLIKHLVESGVPVLLYSLEMSATEVVERMAGMTQQRHYTKVLDGNLNDWQMNRLEQSAQNLRAGHNCLYIRSERSFTPSQVAKDIRKLKRKHGIKIVFIDHIGLLDADNQSQSRYEQVTIASRTLKIAAKKENIAIWAVSQLNRDVTKLSDKKPSMANLRDSGSLEQDGDNVLLIHRPDYYDKLDKPGEVHLLIEKNRNGPTKKISFKYDYPRQSYEVIGNFGNTEAQLQVAVDEIENGFR